MNRVVITGIGALTPIGNTASEYKEALFNGISGAAAITRFDASEFSTKFACEVKGFNAEDILHRREVRRMDAFVHYAIAACEEAISSSGINLETIDKDQVGVIWGSGIGGLGTMEKEIGYAALNPVPVRYNPFFIPKLIVDIAAGHISIRYGFRGPNYATVSACASSNNAIASATDTIRLGRAKIIVTGGSEASVTKTGIGGFGAVKALSKSNENAATASRPFDKDRNGFVLGEGAGALILEDLEHAKARGATIYAEVSGSACTADAHHITAPHPEGLGASNVMVKALKDAKLNLEDVDYINVHGTSTPLGDAAEAKAILTVFGEHAYKLNISSTKSMTGHLLGAAGAVEAVASIFAIQNNVVPPTINHFTNDPELDQKLNFTFNQAQNRTVDVAMSNTFGFGGHNSSIIFKSFTD